MQFSDGITEGGNAGEEIAASVPETFSIRDHRSANWLVRRINEARRYAASVRRYAESELKRAQREEEFLMSRYGAQLEQWAIHEINRNGGRRKFVALPGGRVCLRRVPAWLEIADESQAIGWCRTHLPSAVQIIERLRRTDLRHHVEETGEVPEGVAVRGECQRLTIQDLTGKTAEFSEGGELDAAEEQSCQQ